MKQVIELEHDDFIIIGGKEFSILLFRIEYELSDRDYSGDYPDYSTYIPQNMLPKIKKNRLIIRQHDVVINLNPEESDKFHFLFGKKIIYKDLRVFVGNFAIEFSKI